MTLRNEGLETSRSSVPVTFADQRREAEVELSGRGQRTVRVEFTAPAPGTYALEAGNVSTNVRVVDPDSIVLSGVPARAPPGSKPLVTVTDATGSPIAGANVFVENRTVTTNENGRVRVPLSSTGAGDIEVTARVRGQSATRVITVTPDATRVLSSTLGVRPTEPSLTTRPTARVVLANPWTEPLNATVRIDGPGSTLERAVTVSPGQRLVVSSRLAQRPPGTYDVQAAVNGQVIGEIGYRVTGYRRIVSALATSGGGGTTGLS